MICQMSGVTVGIWNTDSREGNLLDGGAHFYGTYETSDGKFVSIGSIEPQFYELLLEKTGLKGQSLPAQMDRKAWAQLKSRLEGIFKTKTREEWCAIMEGTDICFAPVLTMGEAREHPHNVARQTFVEVEGAPQPAPAPRFSRTPGAIERTPVPPGHDTLTTLAEWGLAADEVARLRSVGCLA
mgnify:CR=1 FL=1